MNRKPTILGIIPARGGSKSIPRKNIKLLAGKPLIAYSILEAAKSRYLDRIVVTTEDGEIARVAEQYGADIPFIRPMELALDETTDLPVFQHCLEWLKQYQTYRPDLIVHLRPTSPLRTAGHIDQAVQLLMEHSEADSVRSVCRAGQHPLKMWAVQDEWLTPYVPATVFGIEEAHNQPRQLLPKAYVQNGAVDVVRASVIEAGSMSGRRIVAFEMDELNSVNIDSPVDWLIAENLLQQRAAAPHWDHPSSKPLSVS
jgi:N-acylneuraminate cytidylyltransferase